MTTREVATHIYYHIQNIVEEKINDGIQIDEKDQILYIENLMVTHFEIDNVLGSKGFMSISNQFNN